MYFRSRKKLQGEVSLSDSIETDQDGNDLMLMDVVGVDDTMLSDLQDREDSVLVRRLVRECLTDREREIVTLRYGLGGRMPRTQREIAKKLGISRSYVSRIEKRALEKLEEKGAYETFRPDVVVYDVLGDVVCGGFSMPMRAGYADRVFIVTSGENMALHAAANIAMAVENFRGRGYASLGGLILNRRNVKNEEEKVVELAGDISSQIVGSLSLSDTVHQAAESSKTVLEAFPDSPMAAEYRALAENVLRACAVGVC